MWITVMNLLMLLAVALLLLFTGIAVRAYVQERHSWKDIEVKASQSGIKGFDESQLRASSEAFFFYLVQMNH